MTKSRRLAHIALHRAFDETRFGPSRTLDIRSSFPTAAEAVRRAEQWLRERQVSKAGAVLVITGQGVVAHTSGSFVVILAPIQALFETRPRARGRVRRQPIRRHSAC